MSRKRHYASEDSSAIAIHVLSKVWDTIVYIKTTDQGPIHMICYCERRQLVDKSQLFNRTLSLSGAREATVVYGRPHAARLMLDYMHGGQVRLSGFDMIHLIHEWDFHAPVAIVVWNLIKFTVLDLNDLLVEGTMTGPYHMLLREIFARTLLYTDIGSAYAMPSECFRIWFKAMLVEAAIKQPIGMPADVCRFHILQMVYDAYMENKHSDTPF